MKASKSIYFVSILFILLACSSDNQDVQIVNTDLNSVLKNDDQPTYPNLIVPKEWTDLYFSDDWDQLTEEEYIALEEAISEWLDDKTSKLDKECNKTEDCKEKMILMDQLMFIQKQIDILGLGTVGVLESLCNGFYDIENTGVNIIPGDLTLEVDESMDLDYEVVVGNTKCTGNVEWASDNAEVAWVNQSGYVTALSPGVAYVYAFLQGTDHIQGQIRVEVTEPEDSQYEIVFVLDASPDNIPAIFEAGGFKESGTAIYQALHSYFGDNFKFGLVGFDHHTVLPFGSEPCTGEWLDLYAPWSPVITQKPFDKWLDFTNSQNSIQSAITDIKMMCNICDPPQCMSSSAYTAITETINQFNWSENAKKIIIIFGRRPVMYLKLGTNDANDGSEGVSGLTAQNVMDLALDREIKIFSIGAGTYNSTWGDWLDIEFETLATGTGGVFMGRYETWGLGPKDAVLTMINRIESSF